MVTRTHIPAHYTNFHQGRLAAEVMYIVIHDGETDEGATAAEGMGHWFATPNVGGSANAGADTDSVCTYVDDDDTPFGAPGVNAKGWHLELAGRAGQTVSQWADAASKAILVNGATAAAEKAKKFAIPPVWLTDGQLLAGNVKGFITHRQATRVLGPVGGHTDPGPNFPDSTFINLVKHYLGLDVPQPVVAPPVTKTASTKIVLKVDGAFGNRTKCRLQQWAGVKTDGVLGPQSWKAIQTKVNRVLAGSDVPVDGDEGPRTWTAIQRLVGVPRDGVPGAQTYTALQTYLNRQP
jgi:hypothetical protein